MRIRFLFRGRRGRGQALAELAIILPVLLGLMLGVEELGRLSFAGIVTAHAAHAGAIYGSQSNVTVSDDAGMVSHALADGGSLPGLAATATHVCTCDSGAGAASCELSDCPSGRLLVYAQVNTTSTFTPLCSLFGWPATMTLHGKAVVRARR